MTPAKIKLLKWLAFIIATSLTLTTIFILPRLQKTIPDIPVDQSHAGISKIEECIHCHINSTADRLPDSHKARQQCLFCHKYPKERG